MQISQTESGIYVVKNDPSIISGEQALSTRNLTQLCQIPILTYGGLNTDILTPDLRREGFEVVLDELCPIDDEDIGLRMPEVWYLNKGTHCISIPMYYNFLQMKSGVMDGNLETRNREVVDQFGKVAMIEVYFGDKLFEEFDSDNTRYFGTPRTLTECMRVLEGWDISRVPRLADYVDFSELIRSWSKDNFPDFNESEWYLGKNESEAIRKKDGSTNVRKAIKYFWENFLEGKSPKISPQDIEIDVINPTFADRRQPDLLLVGENAYDFRNLHDERPDYAFTTPLRSYSTGEIKHLVNLTEPDGKAILTARLGRKRYPNTPVIMIENVPGVKRFSLMRDDEIKEIFSPDVATIADVIATCVENRTKL